MDPRALPELLLLLSTYLLVDLYEEAEAGVFYATVLVLSSHTIKVWITVNSILTDTKWGKSESKYIYLDEQDVPLLLSVAIVKETSLLCPNPTYHSFMSLFIQPNVHETRFFANKLKLLALLSFCLTSLSRKPSVVVFRYLFSLLLLPNS